MNKKVFLGAALVSAVFVSCEKDDEPATSELGEAKISGRVVANLNETNDANSADLVEIGSALEGVEGMQVSIEVDTKNWDQHPDSIYSYDKRVYTAVTDADGNYSFDIPATEEPYTVDIKFGDVFTTKTLYTTDGSTKTQAVKVTLGDRSESIFSGAKLEIKDSAMVKVSAAAGTADYEYGTATITGKIFVNWDQSNDAPTSANQLANGSAPLNSNNRSLKLYYEDAPYGREIKGFTEVAIKSDGTYSATVYTEMSSAASDSVEVRLGMDALIGNKILSNSAGTGDSTVSSVFALDPAVTVGGILAGQIKVQDLTISISDL